MYEVEPLGIKVTIVVPGLSRRDGLGPASLIIHVKPISPASKLARA